MSGGQKPKRELLDAQVEKFWSLESLGILPDESHVHEEFLKGICYDEVRRSYTVGLPWKENALHLLPTNYGVAVRRLDSTLRKLKTQPQLLKEYDGLIQAQLNEGIVEICKDPGANTDSEGCNFPVHYIPHRAVIKESKTTKTRIVLDVSCKGPTGEPSLNQCLFKGPDLNSQLFDVLLRFRTFPKAIICDLKQAFHQIRVRQCERSLQFLWLDDVNACEQKIVALRFCRGLCSA